MKVLLAVSGGIDSMYMLHRAPELFPGASFTAAHCNFGLRGAESDGDEAFVRKQCTVLGIECLVRRFDTVGYASAQGVSMEMAARTYYAKYQAGSGGMRSTNQIVSSAMGWQQGTLTQTMALRAHGVR